MRQADASESPNNNTDDYAIDASTALLFPEEAPLASTAGKRDSRAVWARVLSDAPSTSVLVYLHGNNNYVTVDRAGQSRVPDWAEDDPIAKAGAAAKKAAPLSYKLDRIDAKQIGKAPLLLVPEDAIPRTGAFWASEPAGQYADQAKLGQLIGDCATHLSRLRRADGRPFPPVSPRAEMTRLYLCGHSGAGLPLQEAAASDIALPASGIATDLWLFDCTYWSNVANFAAFCEKWHQTGRLAGGKSDSSRFVCVYRPTTQTEAIADILRGEIAKILGVGADSLVKDHAGENFDADVRPALRALGALFVRTTLPHDDIPTFFIPHLIETAG